MKVVVYLPTFASGGAERLHINLAPGLIAKGADMTFLVNQVKGSLADAIPPGVRLVSLERKRTLSAFLPLLRYIRKEKPDILLSNLEHTNVIAILAVLLAGTKTRVIVTQHNTFSIECSLSYNWKYQILPMFYPALLRHSHGIVTVSRGVAEDLVHSAGIPLTRSTVIYNPIVTEDFTERAEAPIDHPWLAEGCPPYLVAVGRLVPQKNFSMVLAAFAKVAAKRDVRFIIVGEGWFLPELQAVAASLGITDKVNFAGFTSNPLPFMRHAAGLVLGSNYEGFGNVIVEALACGTPVVSTDCPFGPGEILDGGTYGTLVPVDDAEAMAAAMEHMLSHPSDPAPLRARAQEFTVERAAEKYMQLFRSVSERAA